MSGLMGAQLPERLIRSSNRQKVLDFCTLAVYDDLNLVNRILSVISVNIWKWRSMFMISRFHGD